MNSLLSVRMKDLEDPKRTVPSTHMPEEAEVIGLWILLKEHKKAWLLPIMMIVLLLGALVVTDKVVVYHPGAEVLDHLMLEPPSR